MAVAFFVFVFWVGGKKKGLIFSWLVWILELSFFSLSFTLPLFTCISRDFCKFYTEAQGSLKQGWWRDAWRFTCQLYILCHFSFNLYVVNFNLFALFLFLFYILKWILLLGVMHPRAKPSKVLFGKDQTWYSKFKWPNGGYTYTHIGNESCVNKLKDIKWEWI